MIETYIAQIKVFDNKEDKAILNNLRNNHEWHRMSIGSGTHGTFEEYQREFYTIEKMQDEIRRLKISGKDNK